MDKCVYIILESVTNGKHTSQQKEQHFDARTELIKIGGLFWLSLTFVRGRRGIIL